MARSHGRATSASIALLVAACVCAHTHAQTAMPPPFTRVLSVTNPLMTGNDVFILQNLLSRAVGVPTNSVYDAATASAVKRYQTASGIPATGITDAVTAGRILDRLGADGYRDNGTAPGELGFKYKVYIPIYRNRSQEVTASLIAANGTAVYNFTVRAHGVDTAGPAPPWPYFNSCCDGLNEFTSNGNTPTGLTLFDLNSPEDDPVEFGPYPVNRAVQGIEGNAAFLIPNIRNGILMHTGAWANYSNWQPGLPMPNSLGCVHAYPSSIYSVWQLLAGMGVEVRPNTDGKTPYPYTPQGLLSIELQDP